MRRTEFERQAQELWWAAFGAKAEANRPAIERLVATTVALAYGEKLLDQEYLPAATGTLR